MKADVPSKTFEELAIKRDKSHCLGHEAVIRKGQSHSKSKSSRASHSGRTRKRKAA